MFLATSRKLKKSPLPKVVGPALLQVARANVWAWDRALEDLKKTQMAQLLPILEHAKNTHFGRLHNFSKIKSYEDYKAAVPVGDYDSFEPYITRMRGGERNLIVPEFVKYYGNSSGSSTKGKSKFLPITDRQLRMQRKCASDPLWRFLDWKGVSDFSDGYFLGLFPPTTLRQEGKVFVSSNPALMVSTMPAVGRMMYLPDKQTMDLKDYDKKLEVIAERFLDYDVRLITGTTCWFSLLFDKLLEAARRRGRKAETVTDLWPNLELLIGGGVAAEPYAKVLEDRLGSRRIPLVDTYNATEGGIYAATDHMGGPGMLMIPHRNVFFEFIPHEEVESDSPTRVPLWEVEPNRLYAIVVTTVSGLYSYLLGDLVRFPTVRPLRIEFAGRLSGCLSTTQELTTHVEIQKAMDAALHACPGSAAVDFTAGADVGVDGSAKSRYIVFAEFMPGREPREPEAFLRAFDASLCQQNRVYREHREGNTAILAPELVQLPEGSVKRLMSDIGNVSVQTKFPRIVDDERKEILRTYGGASTVGDF